MLKYTGNRRFNSYSKRSLKPPADPPADLMPMKLLDRLSSTCNAMAERLLAMLGLIMALVVVVQVVCRYGFNASLFWSEELARYLLIWLTFLGATCAYRRHVHPSINLIPASFQRGRRGKLLRLIVHFLSLGLFLIMLYYGTVFAVFIRLQTSPALGLPKWITFSIIPFSGLLLCLHCLAFIALELQRERYDG